MGNDEQKHQPEEVQVLTDDEKAQLLAEHHHRIYLLGIFCLEFATVEALLHDIVQRLTGLEDRLHQAIFSGLRADAAMKQIKRLLEANGKPSDLYADIFKQLKILLEARNLILHYGLTASNIHPDLVATNSRLALSDERLRTIPFTTDVLERLIHNANKVTAHLSKELCQLAPDKHVFLGAEFLQQPWRDIPPLQSTTEETWRHHSTQ